MRASCMVPNSNSKIFERAGNSLESFTESELLHVSFLITWQREYMAMAM